MIKNLKNLHPPKIQSSGLTDDDQQIWKFCIHRKSNPALTMDDDKQIWKSTSTGKSNPTSSPRMMTSNLHPQKNQSNGLNWMSTYIIAGSVCHATCHVPVRYFARGFSRLGDWTCTKVYGSEGAVDFGELRTSTFEVLHVLPISRSFASLLLLLQVWSKPVENRSLRTPESFTTKRNPQLHLRESNAD